jgi:hypothetical protein
MKIEIYPGIFKGMYYIEFNQLRIGQNDKEIIKLLDIDPETYSEKTKCGYKYFTASVFMYNRDKAYELREWLESIIMLNKLID